MGHFFIFTLKINFIYLFFYCAGSWLLCMLFSSCREQGLRSSCIVWASHCGGISCCGALALGRANFSSWGFQALGHRLSGIFLDRGLNSCLLHQQVDSLSLSHQGSPIFTLNFFYFKFIYFLIEEQLLYRILFLPYINMNQPQVNRSRPS